MTQGLATLPMYDWPELRAATDALWASLRDALRSLGIAAPDALDRGLDPMAAWTHPDLVLGQTCGLPLVRTLPRQVTVLGAPDFGLAGCAAGEYCSVVVVRADDARAHLADFRRARLALNDPGSQSGYAALLHQVAPLARVGRFFGSAEVTGAHAASATLVADGGADLAAIDAISWRMIRRFRPEAARLRVLMRTDPTPGLPYVCAAGADPAPRRAAITAGIAALDEAERADLGLRGFRSYGLDDYEVIRTRAELAETQVRLADRLAGAA